MVGLTYQTYYGIKYTMKQKMVVTNLRMPEVDWLQMKSMAAERGMSVNAYVRAVIDDFSNKDMLAVKGRMDRARAPIWKLPELARGSNKDKGKYELSEDDKIIYGLDE